MRTIVANTKSYEMQVKEVSMPGNNLNHRAYEACFQSAGVDLMKATEKQNIIVKASVARVDRI